MNDDAQDGPAEPLAGRHVPVLLKQTVDALGIKPDGVYVDATFGRGGHSREILKRLDSQGRLFGFDRDPQAIESARQIADERLQVFHARFSNLVDVLGRCGVSQVDGVLIDLGVSSPQLDQAQRGFSFQHDGPLDMRMDPTEGFPASEWLNEASEQEIREVIKNYGEERFAGPIAKAIVARRTDAARGALSTTKQLADLVASVIRRRSKRPPMGKNEATRTFQAIRIFINQELEELALVLNASVQVLAPGGYLAVLSFHSLEDRIVKEFFAVQSGRRAERDPIYGTAVADPDNPVRLDAIARTVAAQQGDSENPRERSAVLRVARRVESA